MLSFFIITVKIFIFYFFTKFPFSFLIGSYPSPPSRLPLIRENKSLNGTTELLSSVLKVPIQNKNL
jgi:hypothetical protein